MSPDFPFATPGLAIIVGYFGIVGILTAVCTGLLVVTSLTLGDVLRQKKIDDLTWANWMFEAGPARAR